jgi:hypothetical protein
VIWEDWGVGHLADDLAQDRAPFGVLGRVALVPIERSGAIAK